MFRNNLRFVVIVAGITCISENTNFIDHFPDYIPIIRKCLIIGLQDLLSKLTDPFQSFQVIQW